MSIKRHITVSIEIDQVTQGPDGEGFKDNPAVIAWIASCLNCNVNHVQARVSEAGESVVVLQMYSGLIHNIVSNRECRVIELDEDIGGACKDRIAEIDGEETYWSDRPTEVNPDYTSRIGAEIDAL